MPKWGSHRLNDTELCRRFTVFCLAIGQFFFFFFLGGGGGGGGVRRGYSYFNLTIYLLIRGEVGLILFIFIFFFIYLF